MQTEEMHMYNENGTIDIDLADYINRNLFKIDNFLMKIDGYKLELLGPYLEKLEKELDQNIMEVPDISINVKLEILGIYPDLLEKAKKCILSFMNYDKYSSQPNNDKLTMLVSDYLRGYLFFSYTILHTLTMLMTKYEVIELWKEFVDDFIKNNPPEFTTNNLDDLLVDLDQFTKMYQGHKCITFKLDSGPVGFKITKCLWFEVMRELEDKELCYAISCTGDFQTYKMINPDCELTRPKTLVAGDSYCDFFLIDVREEKKVEHPSEEFWSKLDYR